MKYLTRLGALAIGLLNSVANAQKYDVLHNFTGNPDGGNPYGGLVLSGGTLYGTTYFGGAFNNGTVFKINTDGSDYLVLYSFSPLTSGTNPDGANPQADLILSDGTLYGTTVNGGYVQGPGGSSGQGTVFAINTDGTGFRVLINIPPSQPCPHAGLVLDNNTLYGTTYGISGGSSFGMAFKINTDGTDYAGLKGFGPIFDGRNPAASLILSESILYGTTSKGGSLSQQGAVFRMNTDGTGFTNLLVFSDGGIPLAALVLGGSTLYGTTGSGGGATGGSVFKINTDGTGYTLLKAFPSLSNNKDGAAPVAGLVLNGSSLYGTAKFGGIGSGTGFGTIFKLNTDGSGFTVLKAFVGSDGSSPRTPLVLAGNTLYGTTYAGGSSGLGVVFKLEIPIMIESTEFSGGNFSFSWSAVSNAVYRVQYTSDLSDSNWVNIGDLTTANAVSVPATNQHGFYRVVNQQ